MIQPLVSSADGEESGDQPHAEQPRHPATDDGDRPEPRDAAGAHEEPGPRHVQPGVHPGRTERPPADVPGHTGTCRVFITVVVSDIETRFGPNRVAADMINGESDRRLRGHYGLKTVTLVRSDIRVVGEEKMLNLHVNFL